MIIRLWALCQGERHMVTMHVFAVTGIRCHTQYLARSVTLDTVISLPKTSRILENTEDMCSMQSMKSVMQLIGGEPLWRITVFMLCIEHMCSAFSRMRLVLCKETAASNVTNLAKYCV